MMTKHRFWHTLWGFSLVSLLTPQSVMAQRSVTFELENSLIDTTNFTGLAPYYWFANFGNPSPVTGAPMNQLEARNLPSWIHLGTDPACIGKADDCVTDDSTIRTGFSFVESGVGSSSTGGHPNFNVLTLPDGTTGISGQAVDDASGLGTTSQMVFMRILEGAPPAFRMWVVTDHGSGVNFHVQNRMRVSLRGTDGPPDFSGDIGQTDDEALLPGGVRIGQSVEGNNGIADAWAFRLDGIELHDVFTVRPTSMSGGIPGHRPAFAGIIIQPIPEPSSIGLLLVGAAGVGWCGSRRRRV